MIATGARPFRPVRRSLANAAIISFTYALILSGQGGAASASLLAFFAAYSLVFAVCCLLYRHDIAAVVRARREI